MHHKIAVPYPDFMVAIDHLAEQFFEILSQGNRFCTLSHNEQIRTTDYAFRDSGEEFLLVLNNSDEPGAMQVAEKLRATIAQHLFDCSGHGALQITASFGVAVLAPDGSEKLAELINTADKRLYPAKEQGRNRVCS